MRRGYFFAHEDVDGDAGEVYSAFSDGYAKGMEFLGGLATALSNEESRRKLIDSIVDEDPLTGQTRLSIPVSDKSTVSNVLNLLAGLFVGK